MIHLEISFLCHKIKQGFIILVSYCSGMQFCSIKFMSNDNYLNIDTCTAWFVIALVRIVGYSLNELIKIYNIDKISQYYKLFVVLENFVSPDSNHLCYCTFCKHVVSEVQILINGFIFLLSIKCFMTADGQLQKVTDKLNQNLPIMVVP